MSLGKEHAREAIAYLNELLSLDPDAINMLLTRHYVTVNDALINHPTVQIRHDNMLGVLGLINGMFGVVGGDSFIKDYGHISAVFSNDGKLNRFELTEK